MVFRLSPSLALSCDGFFSTKVKADIFTFYFASEVADCSEFAVGLHVRCCKCVILFSNVSRLTRTLTGRNSGCVETMDNAGKYK